MNRIPSDRQNTALPDVHRPLIVWAALVVVGLVYTIIWLILRPFHRLIARPAVGRGP